MSFWIKFLKYKVHIIEEKVNLEMNNISVVPELSNNSERFEPKNEPVIVKELFVRRHHYNDTIVFQAP